MPAPLLVTSDPDLLDDLLRLAAAAGTTLDVAHDPAAALRSWSTAALVVVGPDLAATVAAQSPPRRGDVYLVARGEPDYRTAVALGATDVVQLPAAEPWLVEALADDGFSRGALTVGFVGGSGGVGATTLACAVALAASGSAALLDLDPLGPGVEQVVGVSGGLSWSDLAGSQGRLGSRALREALPARDGLAVLGFGNQVVELEAGTAREALAAAQRGNDLVVVDLPRHLEGTSAVFAARCDHVVLLGACSVPGAAAAIRQLARLSLSTSAVQLAARSRPGSVPASSLATALGLPLLATLGEQRRVSEHVDLGLGPLHVRRGALARAADEILAGVGQ